MYQSFSTHSHTGSIRSVTSNGSILASGGADDRICLYNLAKRIEIDDLYIHDGTVNALEFTPCGSYLISGGSDGKMAFIKTSNWKIDRIFEKAHKGSSVIFLSVHPSGKLALSIGSDLILRTWNLINGRQAYATSLKNKAIGSIIDFVQWSPSGEHFLLSGKDTVEVWSTEQAEVVATKKCDSRVTAVCWISSNDILIGMDNGKILFFNWEDDQKDATQCEIYETRVKAIKYLDGHLVTISSSGELNVWKVILGDSVEIDMICGIEIGCRPICVDVIDLVKAGISRDVKDEKQEDYKKTQVQSQFKTTGSVVVEIDDDDNESPGSKSKKRSNKKGKKRQLEENEIQSGKKRRSVKLSNGFIEEDC